MPAFMMVCKICGSHVFLEVNEDTVKESLKIVHDEWNDSESKIRCGLYTLEWMLKQLRKQHSRKAIVVVETEARKELEA